MSDSGSGDGITPDDPTKKGKERDAIVKKDRERINNRILGTGLRKSGGASSPRIRNAGLRNGKLLQFPTTVRSSEGEGTVLDSDVLPETFD